MKKGLITFFLLWLCFNGFAQNNNEIGTLPTLNIKKTLNNNWSLNYKSEFRQQFYKTYDSPNLSSGYQYTHTDAALLVSKKVGLNNSLAGGFLFRFTKNTVVKRSIQQFTMTNAINHYKLSHRFIFDQTFSKNEKTPLRLRYRLALNVPLNGQSVDLKEWYFKISNEYLNVFKGAFYDLEVRLTPTFGYVFTDNNKLELGLEYRLNNVINQNIIRHRYWLCINWYLSL